jgi:hypothetical protein
MVIPSALAQLVRVIGGPTGPAAGPVGPTGTPGSLLTLGATGPVGPTGLPGLTGPAGFHGLASALTGMKGVTGPSGSNGYPGPAGATGYGGYVRPGQFAYFENRSGVVGISYGSGATNCNFYYTPKRSGVIFSAYSGLVKPDNISISIAGNWVGNNLSITVAAPGMAIPFFLAGIYAFSQPTDSEGNLLPWQPILFDVSAVANRTNPFDFAPHGSVTDINCIVMEF